MYKNQLQELAQRSCLNLPSYSCIREGPDHAPRFKATVNFNGETFESPAFCSTLRQAEHGAAEVALNTLVIRGPTSALASRVLDETGVYKNLLQETAHRAGLDLPVYTTVRAGPGPFPIFSCTVELAGMRFMGEQAGTKKHAQKNAAIAAWSALKIMAQQGSTSATSSFSPLGAKGNEDKEQVIVARFLASLQPSCSNKSVQNDCHQGHQISSPVCRDLTSQTQSLHYMHCQSWGYPRLSPESVVYHMWQQEQLLQLRNHLWLQVPLAPPCGPRLLPCVQTIVRPNPHLFVPSEQEPMPQGSRITISTSCPSLYSSNQLVPDPIKGSSTVTIQEIHKEKTEELSELSSPLILDPTVPSDTDGEPQIESAVKENEKRENRNLESKNDSVQLVESLTKQFECTPRSFNPGFGSVDFPCQNPHGFDSSLSNLGSQHPPRASAPRIFRPPSTAVTPVVIKTVGPRSQNLATKVPASFRMRTGVPSSSTRPMPERLNFGGVNPNFMPPPVRIRSVVPACSAPTRKIHNPTPEETISTRVKKDTVPEDVSMASSCLDELQI
ncbi:dsrm domain-containing protein [Cephalotus follicularis]|uniref:Dsrm domain-containing protein n=1 Tax=Cephalotus follicularis TaxID=3775 RepID=A0A1Q3B8C8_CEPFO|nr:dsrm domain-containing protein [Cephalotus follicularis]